MTNIDGSAKKDWRAIGLAVLLVLLTVAAYFPVLRAGYIWDDDDYITENQTLRDLRGLGRIWFELGAVPQYYPLVHTTFWIEYHLWKLHPLGYHLDNVLLHALASLLLARLLLRLRVPGAWLAGALFALHPIAVESVAWITERKNVLSAVFYFAAALAYLRFAGLNESKTPGGRRRIVYLVSLSLFVAAMLSKTVTCSFPAAMLLVCWWQRGCLRVKDVLPTAPFFVIGVGLGLITVWLEKHHVGAQGADWSLSFLGRCLVAGRVLWFYAAKLVWPVNLTFMYPRWEVSTAVWWQWLFPIAALGVVLALWLARRRFGRGPLVAVLLFAGTLGPALGFVNVYPMRFSYVADHFQYLAGAGLMALAAAGLARVFGRFQAALAALPLALAVLTWRQTHIYHDLETLWRDTLRKNPACWMASNNLGSVFNEQGKRDAALAQFHQALRLKPDFAEAMNNVGMVLVAQGQMNEATNWFAHALQLKPGYPDALGGWGLALLKCGRTDAAVALCRRAIKVDPRNKTALVNLGTAFATTGNYSEAIEAFESALRLKPDLLDARLNLGNALVASGQTDQAILQYERALKESPDSARTHSFLANALASRRRFGEAMEHFAAASRLAPNDPAIHCDFAAQLSAAGRNAEAIVIYKQAIAGDANNADAQFQLGTLLARTGDKDGAVLHWREAVRLKPDWSQPLNSLAWVLATDANPKLRDGSQAVAYARRAVSLTQNRSAAALDTLAAAYAEAGRFPDAIETARKALELTEANQKLAAEIHTRLGAFQSGKPWRE
jgi:tetratricopeptide (TPR) repeat protein